jgi:hypothetical protein
MDEKEKEQLRQRYKAMNDEAIIAIVSVDNADYDPDALALAKAELQKRNIPTQKQAEKASEISNERQKEREEIENKPLTKRQKILFTALPAWGIWYGAFIPKEYKRRRKDTNKAVWIGVALYWAIVLLIWILNKR